MLTEYIGRYGQIMMAKVRIQAHWGWQGNVGTFWLEKGPGALWHLSLPHAGHNETKWVILMIETIVQCTLLWPECPVYNEYWPANPSQKVCHVEIQALWDTGMWLGSAGCSPPKLGQSLFHSYMSAGPCINTCEIPPKGEMFFSGHFTLGYFQYGPKYWNCQT
jgi:hypothetical protein